MWWIRAGASKPTFLPKLATRHGTEPVAAGLTPLLPEKKHSSCNLLLLNSHQEEIVVFCHIALNKLHKRLGHFFPSKLLHLCVACFSKSLISNSTISFLWIILQIFLQERPLINETGRRSVQKERALKWWDGSMASHTSACTYWFI